MLSGSSGLGTLSAPRLLEPRLDHLSSFRSSSAGPSPPCPLSIKVLQAPPVDSERRHSVGALTHYFGFKSIYIMTFQIYISSLELLLEPNVQLPACHLHSTCPNESTHIFLLQQIILSLPLLRQCQFTLPVTQGYWVYFWNRPEVNPFSPLLLFAPWCNIASPLAWTPARASSVVSLLPANLRPVLPAAAGAVLSGHIHSFTQNSPGAPVSAQGRAWPCWQQWASQGTQPVSSLVSAHPSPTLLPLLLHSRVTGLSRGAPCLPHTFALAVSSAQHTLPSHVDMASSSTFLRSLFKSHFLSLSWSSYIKFQNTEHFVSIFPVNFAS